MVMALALAAAALYGSADFLGGLTSRRVTAASVLMISAPASAVFMLAAALLAGGPFTTAGLGWALAAGAVGGVGLIVFYAGLAAGPMGVVAPVSALVSTVVPVGAALAMGERASVTVYAGALLCLGAIVLVSRDGGPGSAARARPGGPHRRVAVRGVGYGAAAGLAFGIFLLFIRNAGASGVLWPVFAARVAGTVIILGAAAWLGTRPPAPGAGRWLLPAAAAAGVLDAVANVLYVFAARGGLFGMAVVISSLYPGITVLLARVVLGERMRAVQLAGLALAAAGVALVTL